jgi:hypothetical protein
MVAALQRRQAKLKNEELHNRDWKKKGWGRGRGRWRQLII